MSVAFPFSIPDPPSCAALMPCNSTKKKMKIVVIRRIGRGVEWSSKDLRSIAEYIPQSGTHSAPRPFGGNPFSLPLARELLPRKIGSFINPKQFEIMLERLQFLNLGAVLLPSRVAQAPAYL